ncbi:Hypothetical predicted protein, partial [Pelobates cultripes]
MERAHRAQGPLRQDGSPTDVVCCLHLRSLKDKIMAVARGSAAVRFRGSDVSLFHDLSSLTLDARRARKPVTSILRDKRILYRWGFPFSLQVKHGHTWLAVRWPEEVPGLMRALNLPQPRVRNWILEEATAARRDPLTPNGYTEASTTERAPPR